jgi:Lrp/AsnC family transcriptional regulator for asnA, asnC and gidA
MEKNTIDQVDQQILALMVSNARIPYLEIARACNISGASVHQRVKKMEDAGVILGSRVMVRPQHVGLPLCAFISVKLSSPDVTATVVDELRKLPEVVECHFVTGPFSLLLKLYCRDNRHLVDLLVHKLPHIFGISDTSSAISLEEAIDRAPQLPRKR